MRTGQGRERTRLLGEARRRLGLAQVKKRFVFQAAAEILNAPTAERIKELDNEIGLYGRTPDHLLGERARLRGLLRSASEGYGLLHDFVAANIVCSAGVFSAIQTRAKANDKIRAPRKPRPKIPAAATPDFLLTYEWRQLRMVVLTKRGARCECCGASPKDGLRMHVDHIKPRRTHPELALVESNLQVLCEVCNHGKGNWDSTDWRGPSGTTRGELDSPVPETATATGKNLSLLPRLVRRS